MANKVEIIIDARDRASDDINRVQKSGSKLQGTFSTMSKSLVTAGLAIGAVGAAAFAASRTIGPMIAAASDLTEAQNKVDVVFRESADTIHTWSETAASSMGASQAAAHRRKAFSMEEAVELLGQFFKMSAPLERIILPLSVEELSRRFS